MNLQENSPPIYKSSNQSYNLAEEILIPENHYAPSSFFCNFIDSSIIEESLNQDISHQQLYPLDQSTINDFKIKNFAIKNLMYLNFRLQKRKIIYLWKDQAEIIRRKQAKNQKNITKCFLKIFYTLSAKIQRKTYLAHRSINAYAVNLYKKQQQVPEKIKQNLKKFTDLVSILFKKHFDMYLGAECLVQIKKYSSKKKGLQKMLIIFQNNALYEMERAWSLISKWLILIDKIQIFNGTVNLLFHPIIRKVFHILSGIYVKTKSIQEKLSNYLQFEQISKVFNANSQQNHIKSHKIHQNQIQLQSQQSNFQSEDEKLSMKTIKSSPHMKIEKYQNISPENKFYRKKSDYQYGLGPQTNKAQQKSKSKLKFSRDIKRKKHKDTTSSIDEPYILTKSIQSLRSSIKRQQIKICPPIIILQNYKMNSLLWLNQKNYLKDLSENVLLPLERAYNFVETLPKFKKIHFIHEDHLKIDFPDTNDIFVIEEISFQEKNHQKSRKKQREKVIKFQEIKFSRRYHSPDLSNFNKRQKDKKQKCQTQHPSFNLLKNGQIVYKQKNIELKIPISRTNFDYYLQKPKLTMKPISSENLALVKSSLSKRKSEIAFKEIKSKSKMKKMFNVVKSGKGSQSSRNKTHSDLDYHATAMDFKLKNENSQTRLSSKSKQSEGLKQLKKVKSEYLMFLTDGASSKKKSEKK